MWVRKAGVRAMPPSPCATRCPRGSAHSAPESVAAVPASADAAPSGWDASGLQAVMAPHFGETQ